jgi:hypothetical protein
VTVLQREAVVAELRARREAPAKVDELDVACRDDNSDTETPSSDVAEVSITSVVQNKDYTAYIMRCTARAGPEVWQVRGSARPRRARKPSRPRVAASCGLGRPGARPALAGLEALQ